MTEENKKCEPTVSRPQNSYKWDLKRLRGLAQKVKQNEDIIRREEADEGPHCNEEVSCQS